MNKAKKWIALTIAMCTVIGLCTPLSGTVHAADYPFQEYYTEDLGVALKGVMDMNNFFELVNHDDKDYIVVPAKGGYMFIFDFTAFLNNQPNEQGNYLYKEIKSGINSPRGLLQVGSIVYSVGDANYVAYYDFASETSGKITLTGPGYGLTADAGGNVYVCGASGTVFRIAAGATTATPIYTTNRIENALSILYHNGKLYMWGTQKITYGSGSEIHEIDPQAGDVERTLILSGIKATYHMSCAANGMLFFGNVGSLVAVDVAAADMTLYYGKLNDDNSISLVSALTENDTASPELLGIMPKASNGTSYAVINGKGLYTYDTNNSKSLSFSTASGATTRNLRCRDTYSVNGSEFILTGNENTMSTWKISGAQNLSVDGVFNGGYSEASMRTMGAGVEGSDTVVYAGGYLNPVVSGYAPTTGLNSALFSNGHTQTDAILAYGNKLYLGCYNGAFLVEYDPDTGETRELIPGGIKSIETVTPQQIRIHALAAGDGMLFFSTIPDSQQIGGWLGCYNIDNGTYKIFSHSQLDFTDQILITLAYDEDNNILYGGSSVSGGYFQNRYIPEGAEAKLHAFRFNTDTDTLESLVSTTVGGLTPGNDTPLYIGGIAKDPQSNTFWGKVSQTLFTFKYENGALTTTHQWSANTYASSNTDRYTDSGSSDWFPRPILFDDDHLYVVMDQTAYGLSRFDLNDSRTGVSNQKRIAENINRIYTMGTDGNIYIANGININRVVISRTTMMEQLIDSFTAGNVNADTIISAYNTLNAKEQGKISSQHMAVIQNLLNAECYYYDANRQMVNTTLEEAMENAGDGSCVYLLADYTDTVAVKNGVTLDLNGKNIDGNVNVSYGALIDSVGAGTITGTVSVPADNPYMPLLVPETTNTYRLFEYTAVNASVPVKDEDIKGAINFWFDIDFTSLNAYDLLEEGSNLKVSATLSWTESNNTVKTVEVSFDDVVADWAAEDHSTEDHGLYVQVTDIPYSGVSNITVTPYFEAINTGVMVTLNSIRYDITQFEAHAIFGAYPTDLEQ